VTHIVLPKTKPY